MENIEYESSEIENGYDSDGSHEFDELDLLGDSGDEGAYEPDPEPEDTHEPEPESDPEPIEEEKNEKVDIRERMSQMQRERYKAIQEVEVLRQENELLRKSAEMASTQALKQYDENLNRRYENAKLAKIKAMEEGDVHAQVDADAELALITSEVYQTNLIKAQNSLQPSQYQNQHQQPQQIDNSYYVNQWVNQNPWYTNPRNQEEWEMANQVKSWCEEFNANLYQGGRQDLIESPEYLNAVSQYADSLRANRNPNGNLGGPKRELNMKQSRAPISPVRSGYGQISTSKQEVKMHPAEKDIARRLGVDEKTYLQYRMREEKENPHRRVRR